jgi:hypothetical protein
VRKGIVRDAWTVAKVQNSEWQSGHFPSAVRCQFAHLSKIQNCQHLAPLSEVHHSIVINQGAFFFFFENQVRTVKPKKMILALPNSPLAWKTFKFWQ